ncbi:MAG: type II toxin-antitoxin system VapC family toxin [Gammaproteobacteria bacterium]|nr:type II toxin-antitoxin system VapC family toxin [Gammaproteobacteria bacterium]
MTIAYVDTSALVAVAFSETEAPAVAQRLNAWTVIMSSKLLEAELRSAYSRKGRRFEADRIARIEWIMPNQPLSPEIAAVLDAGHVRGADLWHLATALHVAPDPGELSFVTLDRKQGATADRLMATRSFNLNLLCQKECAK